MNSPEYIFFLLASITLALQFMKDVEFMKVDSRKNFFMMGVGVALAFVVGALWVYFLFSIVVFLFNLIVHFVEAKKNKSFFGDGDKEIFSWLVPGLVIKSIASSLLFLCSLSVLLVAWGVAQKLLKNNEKEVQEFPGLVFICLAFVIAISLI